MINAGLGRRTHVHGSLTHSNAIVSMKGPSMINARRGEVALHLGGECYRLCLTLGALAELEGAFGVADLAALSERFGSGRLSSRDLLAILAAGLRGGGHPLTDTEVGNLPLGDGIAPVAAAIADLLVATFGAAPENPPTPQGA
jgi:hypothetical protein